jgi:hypothetical protein
MVKGFLAGLKITIMLVLMLLVLPIVAVAGCLFVVGNVFGWLFGYLENGFLNGRD